MYAWSCVLCLFSCFEAQGTAGPDSFFLLPLCKVALLSTLRFFPFSLSSDIFSLSMPEVYTCGVLFLEKEKF